MATVSVCPHADGGQRGAVALKVDTVHYRSAQMNQMLLERIYEGRTPDDPIRPAWVGALLVLVLGLILAIARHRARRRNQEEARRLKGPQMVTVREFNLWSLDSVVRKLIPSVPLVGEQLVDQLLVDCNGFSYFLSRNSGL
jgi:hypothetical protein